MDAFIIEGPTHLSGTVTISGAKNAALPILAATLLTDQPCQLTGIPNVKDIATMKRLMVHFGTVLHEGASLSLHTPTLASTEAPYEIVKTMRASSLVLGPLLARSGHAHVSLPGGCAIGARPLNLHISALEKMGATIDIQDGYITATCPRLHGTHIHFEQVTVTGTENIMMAATLAKGTTIIDNAALEPEVTDLGLLLTKMGARIEGLGTNRLEIHGCDSLHGATHTIIPDRIESGTFMMAAAITGSTITLRHAGPQYLGALIDKLREAGVTISTDGDTTTVTGPARLKAINVTTAPYPGFATDLQAQFMACMTIADGTSRMTETIFENRFMHVAELCRSGARIDVQGATAIIHGIDHLTGAPVMATDLRASASLVLAALAAKGRSIISRVYHIDRGYEGIEDKLRSLGATITRLPESQISQ